MKRIEKSKFNPARAAALIPGQTKLQKDCRGRPIKIGDRVDDCTFYVGGIVVAVFGEECIFLTDYDGDFGIGRFASQQCSELRLLPPVTDVESFVADTLAYRATLDKKGPPIAKDSSRADLLASVCTYIDGNRAIDAGGRLIKPGDFVAGTDDAVSSGYPAGGIVVGVAGRAILIRVVSDGRVSYDGIESDRYTVQPLEVRRA